MKSTGYTQSSVGTQQNVDTFFKLRKGHVPSCILLYKYVCVRVCVIYTDLR